MARPSLRLHEVIGWTVGEAGFLGGQPREAASAGETGPEPVWAFCRSTEMISCLLAHLDGEGFCPLGHHLVRAGIWHPCWPSTRT
jgi:hypothetical protein